MDSGLAFEEKAFLSADRLTVWRTNSAVMMLARQSILALCQERCCFKMSENPLEFGMVYVVAKLALCHVFQRVLFFCRVRRCIGMTFGYFFYALSALSAVRLCHWMFFKDYSKIA